MSGPGDAADIAAIRDWLIRQGLEGASLSELFDGFAARLVATGFPLSRVALGSPAIHPDFRAFSLTWRAATGIVRDVVEHDAPSDDFDKSPIAFMLANDLSRRRWRMDDPDCARFPVLTQFQAEGHTEYAIQLVRFGGRATSAMPGIALSACTSHPNGFSEAEIAFLDALTPPLALAAYRIALFDMTIGIMDTYIGHNAGLRILNGQTRRGVGERLGAAILFADLRGFTGASETGGAALIGRLGEHLAAIAEPVEACGGEVLKFLGDGVLAGFPIFEKAGPGQACTAALSAAIQAIARNEAVNARHPDTPALALDVALHRGEVFYGNVGGGNRLDFTVIGPAVNEASRIEALCSTLDQPILMSAAFAGCCGLPTTSLGHHKLRGVSEPREIFALAPSA